MDQRISPKRLYTKMSHFAPISMSSRSHSRRRVPYPRQCNPGVLLIFWIFRPRTTDNFGKFSSENTVIFADFSPKMTKVRPKYVSWGCNQEGVLLPRIRQVRLGQARIGQVRCYGCENQKSLTIVLYGCHTKRNSKNGVDNLIIRL